MNTGVKISELQHWRSCLGLCMICGQPMGILKRPNSYKSAKDYNEIDDENGDAVGNEMESLLLTPECPIRQVMFAHNILGIRQNCHLVDQYTFLKKPKQSTTFKEIFEKNKSKLIEIDQVFATFADDIYKPLSEFTTKTPYDDAEATCKRVADSTTISACVLCNKAMAREGMHINAVYRCFSISKDKNVPELEANTQDSIRIKKLIQQIALYFEPTSYTHSQNNVPTSTAPRDSLSQPKQTIVEWKAKTGEKLLLDGALWRCIAHLCAWGQTNQFRFRLIAVFHAAHYLYQTSSLNGSISIEDWHMHLFRDFYMKTFPNPNTWFGMSQMEAATRFDISQKWGDQWMGFITAKLQIVGVNMESMYFKKDLTKISQFKDKVVKYVSNEQSLLNFFCSKEEAEHGLNRLLLFFKYNIGSPGEVVLFKNCKLFEENMCRAYRKLHHERQTQNHHYHSSFRS